MAAYSLTLQQKIECIKFKMEQNVVRRRVCFNGYNFLSALF